MFIICMESVSWREEWMVLDYRFRFWTAVINMQHCWNEVLCFKWCLATCQFRTGSDMLCCISETGWKKLFEGRVFCSLSLHFILIVKLINISEYLWRTVINYVLETSIIIGIVIDWTILFSQLSFPVAFSSCWVKVYKH